MYKLIFDVDGTLTPSRGVIDKDFEEYLIEVLKVYDGYLVTGSDQKKTIQQIGERLYTSMTRVYQCSGNQVFEGIDNEIRFNKFDYPQSLIDDLLHEWERSDFPKENRTDRPIDYRNGLINFSTIGRGGPRGNRDKYVAYDKINEERKCIANRMSERYPDIDFYIAGETGIDIFPKGNDKSQILKDFNLSNDKIFFFGDAIYPGGNDYPLAKALSPFINRIYCVRDWKETYALLTEIIDI